MQFSFPSSLQCETMGLTLRQGFCMWPFWLALANKILLKVPVLSQPWQTSLLPPSHPPFPTGIYCSALLKCCGLLIYRHIYFYLFVFSNLCILYLTHVVKEYLTAVSSSLASKKKKTSFWGSGKRTWSYLASLLRDSERNLIVKPLIFFSPPSKISPPH